MKFSDCRKAVLGELDRTLAGISEEQVAALLELILGARAIFLAGAGRSGLMIRGFAMRLMHMGMTVHMVGEVTTPAIGPEDLLLIASGSGETASLVAMAQKTKKIGAKLGLITIFPDSSIGKLSDAAVAIPAPTPKSSAPQAFSSVQPMGSLFEQSLLLTMDSLILLLMEQTGKDGAEMFALHANLE